MRRVQRFLLPLVSVLLFCLPQAWGQTVPPSKHVLIVFGENTSASSSVGHMTYLDSLVAKYGLATNYVADTHPSIGNYLAWASGLIQTNNDSFSGTFSDPNIAQDVEKAGLTWKDYVEDINSSCPGLTSGGYAEKHDPLAYFSNINQANRVCFNQFTTDLKNNTLPNLSYLGPNLCDDAHDCSLGTFDSWLQTYIPGLLASPYFQPGGDGLLVITFDEGSGSGSNSTSGIESGTWTGGQVETVVISPRAKPGFKSSNSYHHESVLRLFEEALGLTGFPGASSNPNGALTAPINMSDFFTTTSTGAPVVTLSATSLTFPNQTVGSTSAAQTVTLKNTGTASLTISSLQISGDFAFAGTGNCSGSVAAAASCTISVNFTPSTTGTRTGTVTITDNAADSPQTVSLSGSGVSSSTSASVAVSPSSLDFGRVGVGSSATLPVTVTVSNAGSATVAISAAASPSQFTAAPASCATASCTINATYKPTSTGRDIGTLTITATANGSPTSGSPQTVSLMGRGSKH